jgi:hypothetical protein
MSTKKDNIAIWKDTLKRCTEGEYPIGLSVAYNHLRLTPVPRYDDMVVTVVAKNF